MSDMFWNNKTVFCFEPGGEKQLQTAATHEAIYCQFMSIFWLNIPFEFNFEGHNFDTALSYHMSDLKYDMPVRRDQGC